MKVFFVIVAAQIIGCAKPPSEVWSCDLCASYCVPAPCIGVPGVAEYEECL